MVITVNRFAIATPRGTADRLFAGGKQLRDCEQQIRQVLSRRGYHEAVTPCVEYYDVFLQAESPLDQEEMFKLVDDNGRLLVIRPDSTTPLARVAATRLSNEELPLRLYYVQNVLRAHTGNGHPREIYQAGAELMGAGGVLADLDILTAACQVLECSGVRDYCIELGHAGIYQELIAQLGAGDEAQEEIRHLIERKAFAALGDLLEPYAQNEAYQALRAMPLLFGSRKVLEDAAALTKNRTVLECLSYLEAVYAGLAQAGYEEHITIDLGLVHEMGYYTGILFRGYLSGAGGTVLTGGRYDKLCGKFGKELPAVGFAADLDGLSGDIPAVGNGPKTLVFTTPREFSAAMNYICGHSSQAQLSYCEHLQDALQEARDKGCQTLLDFSGGQQTVYEVR